MTITLPNNLDQDNNLLRGNTYYHAQDPEDDEPKVPSYPVNEIQREHIVNWGPFAGRHPASYKNPPNYAPPPAGASQPPNCSPPAGDLDDNGDNHQEKRFCYIANNMRATAIIAYIVLYSESHTLYSKYSAI